jgi:uncharacterized protein (TIGR03437 family)
MKLATAFFVLLAGFAGSAAAQTFDTSGNGLLKGTFNFREVALQVGDSFGDFGESTALYGTISFDGNGGYTLNGSINDTMNGAGPFNITNGTYSISASGLGFLSSPIFQNVAIYGLVSNGIFIGSSTEGGVNDLFIAAPATPQAANANFSGTYWIANIDFPNPPNDVGDPTIATDALFQLNPDGNGNLGSVSVTGYIGGGGGATVTQNVSGATYSFSGGLGNLAFGGTATSQTLITGSRILYISPDGNFVFGGSASDWDLFVGVRTNSKTAPNFSGLYYQAGLDENESNLNNNGAVLDTYWGSFSALNTGILIEHQRLALGQASGGGAFDYTFDDPFALNSDGISYDDNFLAEHYVIGDGGAIRIGFGVGSVLGLSVALQAPSFSGQGVYLYPNGIANSASSAPFTAGIAPGEFITLYGTGLAANTVVASSLPFPTKLGEVQVMINGRPAPIYYVSATQISVLVPYATELSVADIQVINNNAASNTVVAFVANTAAGVFTNNPSGGIGYAAAEHKDGSLVSTSSPAQPGETILVFLTGLGAVTPPVADGAAGPTNPLSYATNEPTVLIQGTQANITYWGLVPTEAGLYQLNVQIPTGLTVGDNYLDIQGLDSYTSEALISIGSGAAASTAAKPSDARPRRVLPIRQAASGLVRRATPEVPRQ